jgi:hypothetical protein
LGFDFGEKYEVTFGWSQKFGISIWGLLRTVFRRKCEKHKVTSGRSQKVEISIWGLLRTVFQWKCEEHEVTSGWSQKGLNFNLRVNENRFSKHSFYLHE